MGGEGMNLPSNNSINYVKQRDCYKKRNINGACIFNDQD